MRALVLVLALTSCFDKGDAAQKVVESGGIAPVHCARNSGGVSAGKHPSYQSETFICRDATGSVFQCDDDDCVKVGNVK